MSYKNKLKYIIYRRLNWLYCQSS